MLILQCSADACSALLTEIARSLLDGKASSRLKGWLDSRLADLHPPWHSQLRSYIRLLQSCSTALDLIKDVGFEVAFQFLAEQCLGSQQASGSNATQQNTPHEAAPSKTAAGSPSRHISETEAARLSAELVSDLSDKVCHLQLALAVLRAKGPCASVSFPKFRELVTVLKDLQHRKRASHSIVFVKERQSVHAISAMLRKAPELTGIRFFAFTGRASTGRGSKPTLALGSRTRSGGMRLTEQKNALKQFKEAEGMAVLVATAAAEEGLDIINCEMVVCYTVVETGRERAQRRGRARKAGSLFVNIIEPQDQAMLNNACLAEANASLAVMHLSELSF